MNECDECSKRGWAKQTQRFNWINSRVWCLWGVTHSLTPLTLNSVWWMDNGRVDGFSRQSARTGKHGHLWNTVVIAYKMSTRFSIFLLAWKSHLNSAPFQICFKTIVNHNIIQSGFRGSIKTILAYSLSKQYFIVGYRTMLLVIIENKIRLG